MSTESRVKKDGGLVWIAAFIPVLLISLAGCKHQEATTPAKPQATSATSAGKWTLVEQFDYSWQKDMPARFILEKPETYDDPGEFTRLRIQVTGQPEFTLSNEDGWIAYNSQDQESEVYASLARENLAPSARVLILPLSTNRSGAPVILLRSWAYASDPERLHVIGFRMNGEPVLLFNQLFDLSDFRDIDHDGNRELVGFPCASEALGGGSGAVRSYSPFQAYRISQPVTGPAVLSVELSQAYTVEKYGGWAGENCSDQYALYRPKNKKPRVLPMKEALLLDQRDK